MVQWIMLDFLPFNSQLILAINEIICKNIGFRFEINRFHRRMSTFYLQTMNQLMNACSNAVPSKPQTNFVTYRIN